METPFILLLAGFLFIVLFGGLQWLRREGLPNRLAYESLTITLVAAGLAYFVGFDIHPAIFLFILYLITMRVRLLVDLANFFAHRRRFQQAEMLYSLADKIGTDQGGQIILQINRGILALQQGEPEQSKLIFESVLEKAERGLCSLKHEVAARYNLGVALLRTGEKSKAVAQFNQVIDLLPTSVYATQAEAALYRARKAT
jgi:tetratricopeptide (TPR) repeat protein